MEILTAIITILVGGITQIGEGIGAGLSSLASSIFLTAESGTLSVFGTLIIVFAAISLGMGLTRWVINFVTSLGSRNR